MKLKFIVKTEGPFKKGKVYDSIDETSTQYVFKFGGRYYRKLKEKFISAK